MACSALVGACLLIPASAGAQSASDGDKIQNLEHQTEALQKQLKDIKDELARSRKKAEQQYEAVAAELPVAPVKAKAAPAVLPGVKVTLGGFLAAETVWRSRNEVTDVGSSFNNIPYPFSPLFNESEFHGSARQSRISLKAEGNIDPYQKLWGYYEMDFLGVGNTSNFNQSNSWAPRLRQAFFDYDNSFTGFHFLAGQAWSLLTQNQVGITPLKENIPLTIDASYVVGFNYTRNWQLRFVEQFNDVWAAGVSVEAPATIFGGSTCTAGVACANIASTNGAGTGTGTVVNGLLVNFTNTGLSPFLTGAPIATDTLPDVIEKIAFDPGWGHY
ncbi:MAG TPA: FlxA-like family protein, partial [Steroidobacteraceae bacterium]